MNEINDNELPLSGIRVLDVSRVLAGPWCAMVLGDLGADVLKVEHPLRGDDTRDWGMPTSDTTTTYFDSINRNKTSIGLDLSRGEDLERLKQLVADADVLVQNFKHGGAEKLGIGYEDLKKINPRLIYCTVCGYPSSGPEATRPGYDLLLQGEAGLMALNGEVTQPPLKFGLAVVDLFTGQYAAQAVLAALFRRERTGKGAMVELSLLDTGLALTSYSGLDALTAGGGPARYGNSHPSIVPYGLFDAKDGPLLITVGNNGQYQRLCNEVIHRPELATDPRFATNLARCKHREELLPQILEEFRKVPRAELCERLTRADIPNGAVLGTHEALTSERAKQAGAVVSVDGPNGRRHALAPPYRIDGRRTTVRLMPPYLERPVEAVTS